VIWGAAAAPPEMVATLFRRNIRYFLGLRTEGDYRIGDAYRDAGVGTGGNRRGCAKKYGIAL